MSGVRGRAGLSVYVVLDPVLCAGIGMVEMARLAVAGGATVIQLRDKLATTEAMIETGRAIKAALAGSGAALIVNDDAAAARAIGADGLHIGQGDLRPSEARDIIGPQALLGLSVGSEIEMRGVDPAIVDYLGIGPVFATPTKPDHGQVLGIDGLARLIALSPLPAVAIGGLKTMHAGEVMRTGAAGMGVVSAVCGQPDPRAATRRLADAVAGSAP